MNGIMLRATCLNCRHYERDRAVHRRHYMKNLTGMPKLFCTEIGMKDQICEKFVPIKANVANAIWREKQKEVTP